MIVGWDFLGSFSQIFWTIAYSFAVCLILGKPAANLAKRLGLIDIPGLAPHKRHAQPTPLAGGLIITVILSLVALLIRGSLDHEIQIVLLGALVVFLFGLWDDYQGLALPPKLIGQLLASSILVFSGVQVHFITVLFSPAVIPEMIGQILNTLLTLFWLVGITNAFNLIDSMDGIVAGLGSIAAAFFLVAASFSHQPLLVFWAAILLGMCAGLYVWNALLKRFFLGDSGTQPLGFLLASFSILYNPLDQYPASSWIVPILLLGVPIFDTSLVVLSRVRQQQPVGSGRRDHTYHRLIKMGMAPRYAVMIIHLAALMLGLLAFSTFRLPPLSALILFCGVVGVGVIFLLWFERQLTMDIEQ